MDLVNKVASAAGGSSDEKDKQSGGGGLLDKVDNAAGGGKQGEENEDALDKAVDLVQSKVFREGDQSNESAAEQAKDEAISDFVRSKFKDTTGKDFPVADKVKKFGL